MLKNSVVGSGGNGASTPTTISLSTVAKVFCVAAQLGLLILIVRRYGIQDKAFQNLSVLIFFAFLIHSFLPFRYRLLFFTLFSIASIIIVSGKMAGICVVGLGLVLIGICYLPIKFYARVCVILVAGAILAILRVDWISAPWPSSVWPVVSSIFMFRAIIYLYDIHHEKGRPSITRTLSYFFMVPNVCFPLFPVVDYKKFQKNYYNEDHFNIYQRGISWIFRGVLHLLLYRFAYQNLTIDPGGVTGLASMLQFSFSAFLLYLQVSGAFHMIIGILLLFGFNLPETNHRFFLASSFNDFWRRINIYWKDFMMKIFYYPVYFRVKKLGEVKAIVLSTLAVFFATWFLHAYQWFWLRGTLLLEWHDGLYWGILAMFVIANSLYETRYGRERSLGKQSKTTLDIVAICFSTAATFLTIGLLWGMWSSDSLSQWLSMWGTTGNAWIGVLVLIPGLFGMSMLVGHLARLRKREAGPYVRPLTVMPERFWRVAIISAMLMAAVYSLWYTTEYFRLPSSIANGLDGVRVVKLNERDMNQLRRGYYENLTHVNRHSSNLWSVKKNRPRGWILEEFPEALIYYNDFLRYGFTPNVEITLKGVKLTTNQWGMRDKHYDLAKSAGKIRIALIGASYVVGGGVTDDQTFEGILEERLNNGQNGKSYYEILNFAIPGRTPMQYVRMLEKSVLPFKPDILFYVAHSTDKKRQLDTLISLVQEGVEIPYHYLQSVLQQAGVIGTNDNLSADVFKRRILPYENDILTWAEKQIVDICQKNDILPVWIFLPMTRERPKKEGIAENIERAEEAGFVVIDDLRTVFDNYDVEELRLAEWDLHPNVLCHQLIADHLYEAICSNKVIKKLTDNLLAKNKTSESMTEYKQWR